MDVQHAPAAVALGLGKTDNSDKSSEDKAEGSSNPAFLQLLQGLQHDATGLEANSAAEAGAALNTDLAQPAEAGLDGALLANQTSPDVAALVGQMGVSDLVRQTQQLDTANERMSADQLQLQQAMQGLAGPAASTAAPAALATAAGQGWGQPIATVAAGVAQAAPATVVLPGAGMGVAAAAWSETTGTTEAVLQAVTEFAGAEPETEGRVSLLGAWRFDTPEAQAHPVLQRMAGQIEQWAVATAGLQPRGNDKQDVGRAVAEAGAAWLSSNHGSQTQLTENAVRETQSTQDAAFEAATDVPQEDMRFWVQGKQHRADILMDRDGQAVRVQVSVRGNEAQVTFLSDQAQTREMLDESVAQLREMLEQQGVVLSGVTVQADARGQGKDGASPQQNAWESGKVQHASVAVPIDGVAAAAPRATTGVDLYA